MDFPFNSETSILQMYPEGMSPKIRKYICVWLLFTTLCIHPKDWKQPKYLSQEVGINCDICKNEGWAFGIKKKGRFL